MDRKRKWGAGLGVVGTLVVAGALGPVVFGAGAAGAQGTGTTGTTAAPAAGTFHSNEDPAHEKGESAAREAAEDSGQMPPGGRDGHHGGGGFPNEDPAHEKAESAAREKAEHDGTATAPQDAPDPGTAAPSGTSASQ